MRPEVVCVKVLVPQDLSVPYSWRLVCVAMHVWRLGAGQEGCLLSAAIHAARECPAVVFHAR